MTPEQLRRRAWKNIQSARHLLDSDPDYAAQTVGYAAEFALKARFCTRHGWAAFPESQKEAIKLGGPERLLTHDLEALLTFTNDISIKTSSMHNLDWARASDWSVEQRYTPVGTITRERAEAQILETEKLFMELALWEIVEKLLAIEIEQTEQRGPFNFFGLAYDEERKGWVVWFAAWGTPKGTEHRLNSILAAMRSALDSDLLGTLKGILANHPSDPIIRSFYATVPRMQHGRCMASHNAAQGLPFPPPAYVITCVNWTEASVLDKVASLPMHEEAVVLPANPWLL